MKTKPYVFVYHDGNGSIKSSKNIQIQYMSKSDLLDMNVFEDDTIVCWFPLSYLKKFKKHFRKKSIA